MVLSSGYVECGEWFCQVVMLSVGRGYVECGEGLCRV